MDKKLIEIKKIQEYLKLDLFEKEQPFSLQFLKSLEKYFFDNIKEVDHKKIQVLVYWYWLDILNRHLFSEECILPFITGECSRRYYEDNFNKAVDLGLIEQSQEALVAKAWSECIPSMNEYLYFREDPERIKAIQKIKFLTGKNNLLGEK